MSETTAHETLDTDAAPTPAEAGTSRFGPLTGLRVVALLVAVAFLAGAVGWAVGQRDQDPLSSTDVGFMRDMSFHHEQAIALSLILLYHDDTSAELDAYAQEIIVAQRYEQGLFNATLDRYGHSSEVGSEVMGWMGGAMAPDDMPGLASEEQMDALRDASGDEAEALWIALMTEHHLAGLHMADFEARRGDDRTSRNIARAMVRAQRGEVIDLDRYRRLHDLPIPDGFGDPLQDQRLRPLSLDGD